MSGGNLCHETRLTSRVLGYRAVQVLAYIRLEITRCGIAPSYTMICDELGIGDRSKVNKIVKSLERRGLLRRVGSGRTVPGSLAREQRRIALNIGEI